MHLKCPICGAVIPASQINVQELIAVCPDCDHIFAFNRDAVARKAKDGKLKTPARVRLRRDNDALSLSYRQVFGPGAKFRLRMVSVLAVTFWLMALGAQEDAAPRGIVIAFIGVALLMAYVLAALITRTTRITVDADRIAVKSGPLPFPLKDDKILSTEDIAGVEFEETQEVFPPGSVTHHVVADLHNGGRVNVVTALPQEHARYLAATLDDYLRAVAGIDYALDDLLDADDSVWSEAGDLTDGEIDETLWAPTQGAHSTDRQAEKR